MDSLAALTGYKLHWSGALDLHNTSSYTFSSQPYARQQLGGVSSASTLGARLNLWQSVVPSP